MSGRAFGERKVDRSEVIKIRLRYGSRYCPSARAGETSMSEHEPWTIERISGTLGHPALKQRFLGEINRAPAHELLAVFARWQGIAEGIHTAAVRGRELLAASGRDGELPGEWLDITEQVQAEAERLRRDAA
jgi:hypothetical protein